MPVYNVKIECADQIGLVYRVTGVLEKFQVNIVCNDEFVCQDTGRFFMRTQVQGDVSKDLVLEELQQALPNATTIAVTEQLKRPVVLMATKEPYCLGDLLVRCVYGDTPAEIRAVVANHDHLRPLTEGFGIPYHHVPATGLSRAEHELQVLAVLGQYSFDYLVLAKYMRILSADFTDRFPNRIINIHHSFLPAFIGANPYQQAYERGVKIIGATSHFVNQQLDEGPIIAQDTIQVRHDLSARAMACAGRDVEKTVLARALDLVLQDRVFVNGNKTIVFN